MSATPQVNGKDLPAVLYTRMEGDVLEFLVDVTEHGDPGLSVEAGETMILTLPNGHVVQSEFEGIRIEYDCLAFRFELGEGLVTA